jgi:hypothetical protein
MRATGQEPPQVVSLELDLVPNLVCYPYRPQVSPRAARAMLVTSAAPVQGRQYGPMECLRRTVFALLYGERADWMIEVSRWDLFVEAYHALCATPQTHAKVLIYLSSRLRGSAELMGAARTLQKYLDDRQSLPLPAVAAHRLTASEAAMARCAELLQDNVWFTEQQLYKRFFNKRGRKAGRDRAPNGLTHSVLRVLNNSEYLYPAFQFDRATGQVPLELEPVLRMLPQDSSGWWGIFWFFQPHALLDGECPAKVWSKNPRIVAEAARSSFASEEAYW